jgi:hypothetical protein
MENRENKTVTVVKFSPPCEDGKVVEFSIDPESKNLIVDFSHDTIVIPRIAIKDLLQRIGDELDSIVEKERLSQKSWYQRTFKNKKV